MVPKRKIALISEYDPSVKNHRATVDAVKHVCDGERLEVDTVWVSSKDIKNVCHEFDGLWFTTGAYDCPEGAIESIRYARENGVPTLGTCAGFQHIILELARNVLHIDGAAHEEYAPGSARQVVSRLSCSLRGREMTVSIKAGTHAHALYGQNSAIEQYYCNFGVSPEYVLAFERSSIEISGSDDEGVIRIVELKSHPFFMATLFVPQARSEANHPHPITAGFVRAVVANVATAREVGGVW